MAKSIHFEKQQVKILIGTLFDQNRIKDQKGMIIKMAKVIFTPQKNLDAASSTEEKLRLLSNRIDTLEQDLRYILTNLSSENMRESHISQTTP